ncbi:MAG: DUF4491 family protein [Clostridia bacterium]|nr:DUF4491 family protein [Clostridia bacterium]
MNAIGIAIGVVSFVSIGIFHPIVIKSEYHFGKSIWPVFAIVGAALIAISLFMQSVLASSCMAVIGMSSLWSILELFHQEERVKKGWFPDNPNKRNFTIKKAKKRDA